MNNYSHLTERAKLYLALLGSTIEPVCMQKARMHMHTGSMLFSIKVRGQRLKRCPVDLHAEKAPPYPQRGTTRANFSRGTRCSPKATRPAPDTIRARKRPAINILNNPRSLIPRLDVAFRTGKTAGQKLARGLTGISGNLYVAQFPRKECGHIKPHYFGHGRNRVSQSST